MSADEQLNASRSVAPKESGSRPEVGEAIFHIRGVYSVLIDLVCTATLSATFHLMDLKVCIVERVISEDQSPPMIAIVRSSTTPKGCISIEDVIFYENEFVGAEV